MGILSQIVGNDPKRSDFAIPEQRKYPIKSEAQARTSLARAQKFGTKEEAQRVKAAVKRKFPGVV